MELREYLHAARRNRLLVVALVVVGLLGGLAWGAVTPHPVKASAEVYVSARSVSSVGDLAQGDAFTQGVVAGYAHIATTPYVLNGVIAQLGLAESPDALARALTVTALPNTAVVQITAADTDAARAAAIANTVAGRLASAAPLLTPDLANGSSAVRLTRIRTASAAAATGSPWWLAAALGLLAGLFLAVVALVVREALDRRIRGVDELERTSSLPVLGTVPRSALFGKVRPVLTEAGETVEAESFRSLRASIETALGPAGIGVIVVTSTGSREGSTTVAANLALAFAASNRRVAVVDGDLRRPGMAHHFRLGGVQGLTDVLRGDIGISAALQETPYGIEVLAAGTGSLRPSELLGSDRTVDMLRELLTYYHLVIVDTPPLSAVADATLVARVATATVLVTAVERSTRPRLRNAVAALRRAGVQPLGLIATMVPADRRELRRLNRPGPTDVLADPRVSVPFTALDAPSTAVDAVDRTSTTSR